MNFSDNYQKHTSKNLVQKLLLENFYKTIVSQISPLKVKNILDAGCAEGFTLERIKENNICKNLEGVDFSKKSIELGKKIHPKLNLKQGDVYNLKYGSNSFDLVLCMEVLEHLKNPVKALSEIIRVSSKYILLSVPNEPFFRIGNFLRGKNLKRFGNDIEHINHWTSSGFEKFLEDNGLHIIAKKNPLPWTVILVSKK